MENKIILRIETLKNELNLLNDKLRISTNPDRTFKINLDIIKVSTRLDELQGLLTGFRVAPLGCNEYGEKQFVLTFMLDNRKIYGKVNNFFVNWDWNRSDHFTASERLDALQAVGEYYKL